MSWVKLDDQFMRHPKIVAAGRDARDLYIAALCYCASGLTDGFVPANALRILAADAEIDNAPAAASTLLHVGLWETCDGGYTVHDYHDYNPTKEKVLETRAARADAGSRGGKQKASNLLSKRQANEKQKSAPSPSPSPSPSPDLSLPPAGDKPPTPPKAARARAAPDYSQDFETFWRVYPRKVAKDAAWKAWKQRIGSMPPVDALVSAVEAQKTSDQWQKDGGQYIPHPATWLNNGRWNDEPPAVIAPFNPKPGQRMSGADIMARLASLERQERSS